MKLVNSQMLPHWSRQTGVLAKVFHLIPAFLFLFSLNLSAQINGTVTDTDGEPLIGVNILIKGTSSGTITDFDGKYTLDAPSDATLVFSYTGYTDQEVAVGAQTTIDVILATDTEVLDEVVVIGYGVQKKSGLKFL